MSSPLGFVPASLAKDVYKEFHPLAYHPQVEEVYANYTNRSARLSNIPVGTGLGGVVNFGAQKFCKDFLIGEFGKTFFELPKEEALGYHARVLRSMLGKDVNLERLANLHDLGYLPLRVKTLPEGLIVPYGVPSVTVVNTLRGFEWLTNAIETVMSCEIWPMQTAATTATAYHKVFLEFAIKTGLPLDFVQFQGHDFSMRGMPTRQAAYATGLGHLASGLVGTDTIGAVVDAERFYNVNLDTDLIGASVDATEHSVTCSWIEEGEEAFLEYLMNVASPKGVLSVVADTWDFWNFVTVILPKFKEAILAREGAVVIRPDSGDPVEVLCGTHSDAIRFKNVTTFEDFKEEVAEDIDGRFREELDKDCTSPFPTISFIYAFGEDVYEVTYEPDLNRHDKTYYYVDNYGSTLSHCEFELLEKTPESKGLIEVLWDMFGGTITDKGYKLLDEHIGAIYGDSITLERQREILQRLMDKGFASKVVLGMGSYTYQYVTRDTHGSAVKATSIVKDGRRVPIFKSPKGDASKASAKGLLWVGYNQEGKVILESDVSEEREAKGLFEVIFEDGIMVNERSLHDVRRLIKNQIDDQLNSLT